ncbi:hypothetical protein [Sphingomonas hengshuiensis]|uniref:Uncharacterized protein n=1 Tax=Sphingomonas hengshuiensis TaxID=1609977 RepID=A0A7U4LFV1_9SPHN|nr:hypothetical protein [Sphingomonas hengshuiensis]AJP72643.1 hypothetical protein TS85_13955 [Sphingomonas hengshuiensis]
MLALLLLLQTVDSDEVPTPSRLFAKPLCKAGPDEILVCAPPPDRIARMPDRPDPMTADRRPTLWLGAHFGVRIGFKLTPVTR